MSDPAVLDLDIDSGVARIWLARPERRNALNELLIEELTSTVQRLSADPEVRVIVLGGRGRAFCAGADLEVMRRAASHGREDNLADAERLVRLLRAIDGSAKPTIARVQGACYAGGTGLIAACDIAIAAEEARFCFSEVRLGLVPAMISPYVMRAIGYRAALRYMLGADVFDGATAAAIGLVTECVATDRLDARIDELAGTLRGAGQRALAETKRLLRVVNGHPLDAELSRLTAECIADARASAEGMEGLRAALAGESPRW